MEVTVVDMLISTFIFGAMGSLHCALMCGPLAGTACAGLPVSSSFAYHISRIFAYVVLGMVFGLVAAISVRPWLEPQGQILGFIFAGLIIIYALTQLLRVLTPNSAYLTKFFSFKPPSISKRTLELAQRLPFPRPVSFGIMTALLPCGFLYAALTQSALHAHPIYSGLSMAVFGVASAPSLALGGGLVSWLYRRLPRFSPYLLPLLLAISGLAVMWRAAAPSPQHTCHEAKGYGQHY